MAQEIELTVTLDAALAASGVKAQIAGRPKHIYSICNKMRLKGLDFSEVYDVRALRVIVPTARASDFASKFWMRWRISSLISDALIAMCRPSRY